MGSLSSETPPGMLKGGQYGSYWNAFLVNMGYRESVSVRKDYE